MNKPVRVAGAVITGGLVFFPAFAEAPATSVLGGTAAQLAVSALPLRGVSSTADTAAAERLRVLAQYTAADSESAEEIGNEEEVSASGEIASGTGEADTLGSLEPSDTVNEVPVTREPKRPTTFEPEQGETAAEATGDDRAMKFKLSTGFDYSSGTYGAVSDTTILFIPVSGQLDTRSWKFKVTIPWIRIEGPSGVVPGDSGNVVIGDPGPIIENSGLGDIVASATYKLPALGEGLPFIDLTAKVKFPTADEDEFLGTGAFDFAGKVDIFQAFGDLTVFGSFGYRFLGEPQFQCVDEFDNPIDCGDLNNGFLASGGFSYKFTETFSGGGILDWREASTDLSEDPFEVIPYLVWKAHENWTLQAYGVIGLSEGSPNAGGGLQISYSFY